jgi:hypothetical protein
MAHDTTRCDKMAHDTDASGVGIEEQAATATGELACNDCGQQIFYCSNEECDCGQPIFYCSNEEWYAHIEPGVGCFLLAAWWPARATV